MYIISIYIDLTIKVKPLEISYVLPFQHLKSHLMCIKLRDRDTQYVNIVNLDQLTFHFGLNTVYKEYLVEQNIPD